jgi:trehalose 6-phosphate synthase
LVVDHLSFVIFQLAIVSLGILSCDVIGFHTYDYARHFLSCARRILNLEFETLPNGAMCVKYEGREVIVLICHVGIPRTCFNLSSDADVIEQCYQIKKAHKGRMIAVGAEELDICKGSQLKLKAFHLLLEKHPELIDKVVLFEMISKSQVSCIDGILILFVCLCFLCD